jgi:hypothetical protein
MMASVASHKRVGLTLAECAIFEREMPHVVVPELTRSASIQLNARVSLRREDEILSSSQSRWIGRRRTFPAGPRD